VNLFFISISIFIYRLKKPRVCGKVRFAKRASCLLNNDSVNRHSASGYETRLRFERAFAVRRPALIRRWVGVSFRFVSFCRREY